MVLNTKRRRNFPERAKGMPSKVLCLGRNSTGVRSLRAKIVMRSLATIKNELQIILLVLNYVIALVYTKTIIHLSIGG